MMATIGSEAPLNPAAAPASAAYAWYVLAILFVANCFNAMDRSIVTLLVEPIRKDLGMTDTQIGMITGLGYALVYTLVGIAIAKLVNKGNRKNLLAGGIAVWSAMTALTGLSTGFATMLAARFGIAAGEATCYPNALSLIGDYFTPAKRSRAIAIFQLGTYGGIIVGVASAGIIAERYGWRSAFYLLGLPGLLLAVIVALTIREPQRGMNDAPTQAHSALPEGGVAAMWALLSQHRSFRLLVAGSVLMSIAQVTMGSWVPAFLMRLHGVSQVDVGLLAGPVIGLSGVAGTLVGGMLGTRLAQRTGDETSPLRVVLYSAPFAVPALLMFLLAPSLPLALIGGALTGFSIAIHFGPLVAVTIGIVGPENRGVASSLLVVAQFLIAFGLGPLFVGALSDLFEPMFHAEALRWAMMLAPVTVALGWLVIFAAYRQLRAARG